MKNSGFKRKVKCQLRFYLKTKENNLIKTKMKRVDDILNINEKFIKHK